MRDLQIRAWLDSDAAQFTQTPILVTNEGQARLELFNKGVMVDTVHIYRYSRDELNDLLVEMGQHRDLDMSWEKINAVKKFDNMVNNFGAYQTIAKESDEKAAAERAYDERIAAEKAAKEGKSEDL